MMPIKFTFQTILFLLFFHAFTLHGEVIYVNIELTTGNNSGTNWENAFFSLNDGLAAAESGDSLWIAKGTYLPTTESNQSDCFILKSGVRLFGGFLGNENFIFEREIAENSTIISGEIGATGYFDNVFTLLKLEFQDADSTIVDGIVFQNSYSSPLSDFAEDCETLEMCRGGGLFVTGTALSEKSDLIIRNCTFLQNRGLFEAGIYVDAVESLLSLDISHCEFINNRDPSYENGYEDAIGGAICILQDGNEEVKETTVIKNCFFQGNLSSNGGGAIFYRKLPGLPISPSFEIDSCFFSHNFAQGAYGGSGGAIRYIGGTQSPEDLQIKNSTFINNVAGSQFELGYGGALNLVTREGIIQNCTFQNNIAYEGGGIQCSGVGVKIINNSFIENTAARGGGIQIYGTSELFGNLFLHNQSSDTGSALYGLTGGGTGVHFENCTFYGNTSSTGGACAFTSSSSFVQNSIFWQNRSSEGIGDFDFLGIFDSLEIKNSMFETIDCMTLSEGLENVFCDDNNFFGVYPEFMDTLNNNFRLKSCSPGVNAGAALSEKFADINLDIEENNRIIDSVPDIGAYETKQMAIYTTVTNTSGPSASDGSIAIDSICGGIEPYTILQDEEEQGYLISDLAVGEYSLSIIDSIGCSIDSSFQVDFVSADNTYQVDEIHTVIVPSLADDELFIYPSQNAEYENYRILDTAGRTLATGFHTHIDISSLPKSTLIVVVKYREGVTIQKIVKY